MFYVSNCLFFFSRFNFLGFHFHLVEALAIYSYDRTLRYESVWIDHFYQSEDGYRLAFAGYQTDNFHLLLGVPAVCVEQRYAVIHLCCEYMSQFVVFLGEYRESQTTTRQANRWLAENGFYFTVKDIAQAYENAIHGIESSPMQRYVEGTTAVLVHPHFNQYQTYLNDDGSQSHELAIDQVPWLAYSEYKNYLVRVGCSISDKTRLG